MTLTRQEQKLVTRHRLINTTIDTITELGIHKTTFVEVSRRVGLSQGIITFHFRNKKNLLTETMKYLEEIYVNSWQKAMELAGPDSRDKIVSIIHALLEPNVTNFRYISVWVAFWGEPQWRKVYDDIAKETDQELLTTVEELCLQLQKQCGSGDKEKACFAARGICDFIDAGFIRLLSDPTSFDHQRKIDWCLSFLEMCFPTQYPVNRNPDPDYLFRG